MKAALERLSALVGGLVCGALLGSLPIAAQSPPTTKASETELAAKIQALSDSLEQTRAELSESRQEIRQLRSMLEQVLQRTGAAPNSAVFTSAISTAHAPASTGPQDASQPEATEQQKAEIAQDDWQIANERIEELAQDKVESSLKYRLKLSGIVLLNAFSESGQVDNLDVPSIALPSGPGESSGAVGASLRQSILGLTGIGPRLFGADTVGDIQVDFFGGLPGGYPSNTSGVVRLRVARLRMDWANTSLFGGIDVPFFSPNMPTSYMSVAVPAFSSAGNLWTWTPTVGVEQRVEASPAQLKIQAGVMDPPSYARDITTVRLPTAAESSRQPTYALRLSASGNDERHPVSFGISGVYSPQRFEGGTTVNGWGGIADWRFPLFPHAELSGEMFVGEGMDSFGGVPSPIPAPGDYTYYEVAAPLLERIKMAGGWSQLKIKVDSKSEFNFALGSGGRDSADLRQIQPLDAALAALSPRNDTFFVSYIFRPRSDLLLSPEFRRIRTYPASGAPSIASQVGVAAGFLF